MTHKSTNPQINHLPTKDALTHTACELITAAAAAAIAQRGFATIALSGGSTPLPILAALAADPDIDWRRWRIFWSDERTVGPSSPDSNFGAAKAALLDHLPKPGPLVMRLAGEADPDAAALAYEKVVSELVPARTDDPHHLPAFDLILLGMGGDGHTASLFPHTAALAETERLVVANPVPQLNTTRLTFTYPLINAARRVLFLVSGAGKADVLEAVLHGPQNVAEYPSQGVAPTNGTLTWLISNA
ncbi:MAG: 6-phosphogluconolactonase [Caldilineaceae bacterium]|nr:6-phosphogluconolactonase [Caldilineaceae bacterium]MBP8109291.1 6-phosphogluconolactonase [Caldilineaceae bacterium]MBP8123598.1 6-phosphogluconolactonase [Caldilineaceae bacterium]MBP9073652.1 6-phosphogluconolactonase [Caldilineaceae bacterium]